MRRTTNFRKAVEFLHGNLILCNDIVNVDESIWDNFRQSLYDEEGNPIDIYQYYATSCNIHDVEWFEKSFEGGYLFTYSEKLDLYILCVTHWGTPWDGVDIDCINDDINL